MLLVNSTGTISAILDSGTKTLTGDILGTLIVIFMFLFIMAMMFQIPLEFSLLLLLPLALSIAAFQSNFLPVIVFILLYISMIFAKNWIFR